jgi:hypothetical protein
MPYSTFQRHLRNIALFGDNPGAFRYTRPLPGSNGKREYYRIDIHPVLGIRVLDKHFGLWSGE